MEIGGTDEWFLIFFRHSRAKDVVTGLRVAVGYALDSGASANSTRARVLSSVYY